MRCRIDLHCHSDASYDSRLESQALLRLAVEAGLTHLAITDHERIDCSLRLRDLEPPELTIIVGEEIRSTRGDVIGLYVEQAIPGGLSLEATIAAIRAQDGVVGIPHPFDAYRPAVAVDLDQPATQKGLADLIDYVEVHNGRVRNARANERAAEFATAFGVPGVAASDTHSEAEVGSCATVLEGPISSAAEFRAALAGPRQLVVRERTTIEEVGLVGRLARRLRG